MRRSQVPRQILCEGKCLILLEEKSVAVELGLFERGPAVIRSHDLSRPAIRRFNRVKAVLEVAVAKAILIHCIPLGVVGWPDSTTTRY